MTLELFEQHVSPLVLLAAALEVNLTEQILLLLHWVLHYWRFPRSYFLCFMLMSVFLPGQKGDSFWVMDRVLIGPFDITAVCNTFERRWAEEPEQWTGNRRFIFLLPLFFASHSFRTSCKILRSPHLAHKAPQLCRLTCALFLFFVCLFVCLFVFLESLNPLALSKRRVETVRKNIITSSSHKLNTQIKLWTDFKADAK